MAALTSLMFQDWTTNKQGFSTQKVFKLLFLLLSISGVGVFDATATGSGTDYNVNVRRLEFDPGQYFESVTFDIIEDSLCEDIESFTIRIRNPGYGGSVIGRPREATVYIIDQTGKIKLDNYGFFLVSSVEPAPR